METATSLHPAHPPLGRGMRLYAAIARTLDGLQSLFVLALRLYVARVFFTSGWIKIGNWSGTLGLFQNEFHVPLLPPHVAAILGTAAELGLPIFLALGLGTRAAALALLAFNFVAVISYPGLSDAGLKDHILWGTMLLVVLFYGPGRIAVDEWVTRRFAT